MEWLKEELFLIPNWAWIAIFAGVACVLMAIIIVACKKGSKSKNTPEPVLMPANEEKAENTEAETVKEETVTEPVREEPVVSAEAVEVQPEPVVEEAKKEEKPVENKPAAKKTTTAAKPTAAKTTATKTTAAKPASAKTTATKTTAAKPAAAKTTATKTAAAKTTAKTETKPEPTSVEDDGDVKIYHIAKRAEDKKWEVKAEGADKALKLFFTQTEAIDYARKTSGKRRIIVHKESGGTREV